MSHNSKHPDPWVKVTDQILKTLTKMRSTPVKDKLDAFCRIRACLIATHRSLDGWMQWVHNPDIFHFGFSEEELYSLFSELVDISERILKLDNKLRRAYREKEDKKQIPKFSPDKPFYM